MILKIKTPKQITVIQWIFAFLSLILAFVSYLFMSYEYLVFFAVLLAGLNVILLFILMKEALQTRILGKLFLTASTLIFFWIEAAYLAFQDPPFLVPQGLPIPSIQFSPALIQQAYVYIALFHLMLFVGYSLRPKMYKLVSWLRKRVDSYSTGALILPYVLATCSLLPTIVLHNFKITSAIETLLAARTEQYLVTENLGLFHYLSFFGIFGASFLLTNALVFRRKNRILIFIFGAICSLPFIMRGTRHIWLFIGLPIVAIAIRNYKEKISFSKIFKLSILVFIILGIFQLQSTFRDVGWNWEEVREETLRHSADGTVTKHLFKFYSTGQFESLLFAEYLVPDGHKYFLEPVTLYFIIHWVPRTLWPNKPIMQSWVYYNEAYTYGRTFNVTPSIIGQFHINWGIFGVLFIGLLLGFLVFLADLSLFSLDIKHQKAMAVMIGMFYAFIISSFRFYSPIYVTYFVFAVVGMFLLTRKD